MLISYVLEYIFNHETYLHTVTGQAEQKGGNEGKQGGKTWVSVGLALRWSFPLDLGFSSIGVASGWNQEEGGKEAALVKLGSKRRVIVESRLVQQIFYWD